ncbi:MAG: type VII secretion protein EssC, partial [Clostridia bacterium]|nr:type VII secretion protein EssC [Clostridia bacterium]
CLPYYVVVVADAGPLKNTALEKALAMNRPELGVSGLFLGRSLSDFPNSIHSVLELKEADGGLAMKLHTDDHTMELFTDECDVLAVEYERFARAMAPIRLPGQAKAKMLPKSISFLQGWNIPDLEQLDISSLWRTSCSYKSMAVPIGIRANGEKFFFDIHEKAHGPHGLVAGMTGSGKSEMIQSWILSMAMQFSPENAAFVLIDFKGTGLILPFLNLPHLAGTISDLDVNISRNLIALNSELARRKRLFDEAGVNKISDYLKLYQAGKVREPMPYLFVVIDEYAEFRAKFPDFTGQINSLFRTGRSIGVHIILLTQNPSGVVSGESESNVRFRWCLKVASAAASKEMLGEHDDAAYITNPGRAYVRVGSDEVFEPVQSFYSGAPYYPKDATSNAVLPEIGQMAPDGTLTLYRPELGGLQQKAHGTEIAAVVDHIRNYTRKENIPNARPIWQNRMPGELYLPDLLQKAPPPVQDELRPIIGLIDDPRHQLQRPLHLPLSTDGHTAIIGAPGSGKTVMLQTLAASLCVQYSPDEVNLYIMDFGGWSLGMFRDFPHVCSIANDN